MYKACPKKGQENPCPAKSFIRGGNERVGVPDSSVKYAQYSTWGYVVRWMEASLPPLGVVTAHRRYGLVEGRLAPAERAVRAILFKNKAAFCRKDHQLTPRRPGIDQERKLLLSCPHIQE